MALNIIFTNAGRAAIVNLPNTGTAAVTIAAVGFTATAFVPTPAMTVLPGEIKRVTTIAGDVVAPDVIHLTVRDESADSYTVRGIGLYLADGTLFAAYGQAAVLMEKSSQSMSLLSTDITLLDLAAATTTFGDTNFILPPATTTRQGIVELADEAETDAGTDAVRAVTPKWLKSAVTKWLDARFGAGAPSTFMKSLLPTASAVALRLALGLKSAALKDEGHGNNLDADKLDGQEGAWYADIAARLGYTPLNAAGYTAGDIRAKLLTVDGAGSGIDSDLLDGQQGSYYLNAANLTGTIDAARLSGTYGISISGSAATLTTARNIAVTGDASGSIAFNGSGNVAIPVTLAASAVLAKFLTVDGAGSGADADLLDGQHGSYYLNAANLTGTIDPGRLSGTYGISVSGSAATLATARNIAVTGDVTGAVAFNGAANVAIPVTLAASAVLSKLLTVDGAGSGVDADTVDGLQGADLVQFAHYASRSLTTSGRQLLPSGLLLQWCRGSAAASGEAAQIVIFPITFPNACLAVQVTTMVPSHNTDNDMWYQLVGEPAANGCTIARAFSDSGTSYTSTPIVVAIGH